jgi:MOSC domain-containing protein YiiM
VVGRVVSINVSRGGVPKRPVEAAEVTALGLTGDAQHDRRHHGGPERALCLYSAELIAALQEEGHPISVGSAGENLTIEGLDWAAVVPGSRLLFGGGVEAEVTRYTVPCSTIRGSFLGARIKRIAQDEHPGWSRVYARVNRTGRIATGESVELIAPPSS